MTTINLIKEYLSAVEECLVLFEQKFGRRDLVRAWREGAISQTGKLLDNIGYQMHGVGCTVEYADHSIDFDFANQYEVGCNAWFLWRFAKQFPERYPEHQESHVVETALSKAVSKGEVSSIKSKYPGESNDKLFRLSENAKGN